MMVPQVPGHSHHPAARRVQLTVVAGQGPSVQLGTAKLPARSDALRPNLSCCARPNHTACGRSIVAIATRVHANNLTHIHALITWA
jgi:hypothetical protein